MYQRSGLQFILDRFHKLLASDPKEEKLQKFIEQYPVLLHQFSAEKVIPKSPILSSYIADFGITTSQKELILIEIERATTKLIKKNRDRIADLTYAFDRARSWLNIIVDNRITVLDDLSFVLS
ncbi:MAG: Shedu anti-phage system protein SduA domain-containing protein [Pseudomonadota bacterium]